MNDHRDDIAAGEVWPPDLGEVTFQLTRIADALEDVARNLIDVPDRRRPWDESFEQ